MLSHLFGGKWKPYVAPEIKGASGGVSVTLRGLECLRHERSGKLKFRGDFGAFFVDWLSRRWKQEGGSPFRMCAGSPWHWTVEIRGFSPIEFDVVYSQASSEQQMFSDTLDAIIDGLEKSA
jgi:hypothetical protein